jgi:hypothetical protein
MPVYSFNAQGSRPGSAYQANYGAGLGGIQQFGYGNPYGPYYGLQKPGQNKPGQGASGGGGSTTTATSGPTASAEAWMNDVLAGKNLPFSPFQKSQMLSQQSDMSAAAEGARNQQLMGNAAMGGASAGDPSLNAARMSNMAARQAQNQTAARDIDVQANTANFGAQMDAASQLNQNAMNREAFQNGMQRTALGFMPWAQGGGGGGQSGGNNFGGNVQNTGFMQFGHNAYTNAKDPTGAGIPGQLSGWQSAIQGGYLNGANKKPQVPNNGIFNSSSTINSLMGY